MTQEYHIISGKTRSGPYDMVALVRKIRNGSLTGKTLIQLGEAQDAMPASEWPQLAEFFTQSVDDGQTMPENAPEHRTLEHRLQSGWRFLQRNHYSTVFAGLLVLSIILVTVGVNMGLPIGAQVFAYMAYFIVAHFMLSCYMLSILRMMRGQPVNFDYMQSKIEPGLKSLMLCSLFVCVPAVLGLALLTSLLPTPILLIGLFIFTVPGLFTLALYSLAPLLILDKGYDFWDAMEASRKAVLKGGVENMAVFYGLFVINFLAALLFLLPMSITLPITMGALAEIYDETFA